MAIEKLNDGNYGYWSQKMRFFLIREGLWSVVNNAAIAEAEDQAENAEKALASICLHIDDSQLVHVENAESGRAAWLALRQYHQRDTAGHKMQLLSRLFEAKMSYGESMQAHLNKMTELLSQLNAINAGIDDVIAVCVILRSVTSEYQSLVSSIQTWSDDRLTLVNVKGQLIEEYERLKDCQGVETAFAVTMGGRPRKRNRDHVGPCFYCNGPHFKRECTLLKLNREANNMNNVNNNNEGNINKQSARMARMGNWDYSWCFDSGASSHMCNDLNLFTSFSDYDTKEVYVANGSSVDSKGVGTVKLEIFVDNGEVMNLTINNVLFVPELDENLISVSKLTKGGFSILFQDNECFLMKGCDKVLIAEYSDGLYKVKVKRKEQVKSVVENKSHCVHEWHKILAHRNLSDILEMGRHGLGIKKCSCEIVCEPCIKGKLSRKPFKLSKHPTKHVLDCIVSDLGGPLPVESIGRALYYITFTDLYSGYCEVYPMRSKAETPNVVRRYIEKVKNLTGKKPKIFRSDRGTEYLNNELQSYLADEGIKFECTTGYSPQQNGTAERQNRTLIEATRTVLGDSGLPKRFWAEAIKYVAFSNNRLMNKKLKKTPLELFFEKKPNYSDMHEFGTEVYVKVPDEKRRKLDVKAVKGIYVGHDEASKGYRIADPKSHKITVSRDVVFLNRKASKDFNADNLIQIDIGAIKNEPQEDELENGSDSDDSGDTDGDSTSHSEQEEGEEEEEEFFDASEEDSSPPPPPPPQFRRSSRSNFGQRPRRFDDYHVYKVNENDDFEPKTYQEAISCRDSNLWISAMQEELNSIDENETWEETVLPAGRKAVGSKWVFKIKRDENDLAPRYKARLVAQGFSQKYGTDYDEVFAPVARPETFRILLTVASMRNYEVRHFDFKTAFLNGSLKEEIYLRPPQGFPNEGKVYRLRKSLYGLKQAAKVWNDTIHGALIKCGCIQSQRDKCLYTVKRGDSRAFMIIHVDDLLVATNDQSLLKFIIAKLESNFQLKDLGKARHYLGIDIARTNDGSFSLSQEKYIDKILEVSGQLDAKDSKYPLDPGYYKLENEDFLSNNEKYRKLIGMLLYLCTNTRPDISAPVSILSQKVSKPTTTDLNEVNRIIRYLKYTKRFKLQLGGSGNELLVYSDANWGENRIDRKSNSGFVVLLNKGLISWCCRKQNLVTLSSSEAEYVALNETAKELTWLECLIGDFEVRVDKPITILTDSQSCMAMIKDSKLSCRTKHIDIRFHYVKEKVEHGDIRLQYVCTEENVADLLTKPLGAGRISKLRKMIGVQQIEEEC